MNRDLICVASTITDTAETADQQGTLTKRLLGLLLMFNQTLNVTQRELNVQVQLAECDAPINQQTDR